MSELIVPVESLNVKVGERIVQPIHSLCKKHMERDWVIRCRGINPGYSSRSSDDPKQPCVICSGVIPPPRSIPTPEERARSHESKRKAGLYEDGYPLEWKD